MLILLNGNHKGSISLVSLGFVAFFGSAIVLSVIIINAGFMVSDAEKQVVIKAMRQADQHLKIAGKITGITNVQSNEMIATSIHSMILELYISFLLIQLECQLAVSLAFF